LGKDPKQLFDDVFRTVIAETTSFALKHNLAQLPQTSDFGYTTR